MTRFAVPMIRWWGVACAIAASTSLVVAKDRDNDKGGRRSDNDRPQTRSNNQPGNSGGNNAPKINFGGGNNSGGRRNDNPGNSGGGQPAPRKIEIPRAPSGGGNPGGIPNGQPRIRAQNDNNAGPKLNPPGGGNNNNPVLKRRDNDNKPKGGIVPNPGGNNPVIKPRDRDNKPNVGGNNPNNPLGGNKPVLKPRDNVNPNPPGGGIKPNNPVSGNKPVLKPRDRDNKPDGVPNLGNKNPPNNPLGGDKPVLKPRDRDNKPDGVPNLGNNKNNTPNNPLGGNKPVLKPRDKDGKPDGNNNIPNLGNRNRDPKDDGPKVGRNPELNDAIRKFKPDTAKRERNERDLLKNKDQVEKLLSSDPKLREKVQRGDGKIDLSKLHQEQFRKDRIASKIDKNGVLPIKFDNDNDRDRFNRFDKVKDLDDLDRRFDRMRDPDFVKRHPEMRNIDFNNVSGRFQHRLAHHQNDRLFNTNVGRRLRLQDQYSLYGRGDVARQLNLNISLVNGGGWRNRYMGPIYGGFATNSFSSWYAGPGFYPRYCWTPQWSPWVDWSWWHNCPPIYDPRPIICRPIYIYEPAPVWVVYDYPAWQSLPVVASGTWVDLPPPVLVENPDVQLVAVRFVDGGHSEQELGTRYRAWFQNNSNAAITSPFNVLLLASNTPNASDDLPQAGVTVPAMDPGEMKVVDIRLPFAANKMNREDNHLTPFEYLHVLVDSHRQLQDPTPENNGAVIARGDILPVDPAAFAPDAAAAAPGAMVSIAGEGFGPEPGRLIVSINGEETEATIYGWYDLGVQFELPNVDLAGPTDAEVLVVRGDGAASNPVTMKIAPENKLSEAALPPAPLP